MTQLSSGLLLVVGTMATAWEMLVPLEYPVDGSFGSKFQPLDSAVRLMGVYRKTQIGILIDKDSSKYSFLTQLFQE